MPNPGAPFRLDAGPSRPAPRPTRKTGRAAYGRAWAALVIWYAVVVGLLALFPQFKSYETQLGAPARADVVAPFAFEVTDQDATQADLERIREKSPQIWVSEEMAESRARQRLQSFIKMLQEENPQSAAALRGFSQKLSQQLDVPLDDSAILQFQEGRLLGLRPSLNQSEVVRRLSQIITNIYGQYLVVTDKVMFQAHQGQGTLQMVNSRGTPAPQHASDPAVLWWPHEVQDVLLSVQLPRYFPGPQYAELRQAAAELLMHLIAPNVAFSSAQTGERYEAAYQDRLANPLKKVYATDELIVKKGEPLTRLQADALAYLNSSGRNSLAIRLAGIMLITLFFFIAVVFYLRRFRREVAFNAPTVTLYVLPPLMALAVGQIMNGMDLSRPTTMIWFPAAMVGILSALLMAPQIAFVLVLVASCLFGVVTGQDLHFLVYAIFGGFTAVFVSRWVRARGEVLLVGAEVGLVNVLTLIILSLIKAMTFPTMLSMLGAFMSGIACSLGTLVLLVVFERTFGIVTDLRLLELTGLKHPLIAQFEEKSPGSYQHVLNVMKLAEAAAQAIGANYLLVRAGAYFHDIGKMVKPKYFSENQVTLDDKKAHARLSPYMSVLIIKNHVKEGMELARRYNLPQKVIDFIPQHHGTGLIRYFYSEAMRRYSESGQVDEPREEDFRYPGPKPQSIETAIVLLSDSVEAIAASKFTGGQVSEGELRRMVQTAISERFNDGQFDECDLTLRHLHLIREAFVKTLMARYHFRVSYPAMPKPPTPRGELGGPSRGELAPPIAIAGPASSG